MRFGRNIIIDGSSLGGDAQRRFEAEVAQQLRQLLMFQTGQAVIAEIFARRHSLRIVPFIGRRPNADTRALHARPAFPRGAPLRAARDGHVGRRFGHGTGGGTDSEIAYTPFRFASDMGLRLDTDRLLSVELSGQPSVLPGDDRGEVLPHEMVHSLQQMAGMLINAPRKPPMHTSSEVNAITVANIYASERGRMARADHHTNHPALDPFGPSGDEAFSTLGELRKCLPGLVARLARIDTPYNPFFERRLGARLP